MTRSHVLPISMMPQSPILVQGVVKRYGHTLAVSRADLEMPSGAITMLIGPSGCGKTTLLNMIAGFEKPTEGEIVVNGQRVEGPDPSRGVIFQDPTLFPWMTVWENVLFGPKVRHIDRRTAEDRAMQFLEMVNLARFRNHKPHQLSGGMRHRVAIIRTLVNDPAILLADEPFTALDEHTRRKIQEDFLKIVQASRKTVVFVTHNIDEAVGLADRIVVMSPSPGRVKKVIDITNFPKPRDEFGPRFMEYKKHIYDLITPDVVDV
jgi:NitT/TauT family transport system ATP-binding protein